MIRKELFMLFSYYEIQNWTLRELLPTVQFSSVLVRYGDALHFWRVCSGSMLLLDFGSPAQPLQQILVRRRAQMVMMVMVMVMMVVMKMLVLRGVALPVAIVMRVMVVIMNA